MARYIFITGGVVSSLGKGLASAALGALLQARGYTVRLRKLDPYLNVDPGTMSPFEHGEVFVTDDGAETDLDLGHYERFTGVSACKTDSVSSGRIYSDVLEKERRGDYLGKTIQVIPHVTNQIKDFIKIGDEDVDFMLCEIGGTVGDIEALPFFEAIRQFNQDRRGECIFMHLTLLPYIAAAGELKTKPTQHSVKELRSIGIAPDILMCRSEHEIPQKEREKLALFCNVRPDAVISALDLKSIYDAPLAYHREGMDRAVLEAFGITDAPEPDMTKWDDVMDRVEHPEGTVKIAIVGKYTQLGDAYKSIAEALTHGGLDNRVKVKVEWINSEVFESEDKITPQLQGFNAILVPGGFGERGTEGKIKAAQYAREHGIPYLGICLGMQMAVIEAARNMAGIKDAGSEEFDHESGEKRFTPIVYHLKEWVEGNRTIQRDASDNKGGTMRLGAYNATLSEGSRVAEIYGDTAISERHRHRYEVDMTYRDAIEATGLKFSGISPDGKLPEIVEIPDHPWYIGVQFHPELKSRPFDPHPLFASFVEAAVKQSRLV
ncbi:CTP synthase [Rhodobacterales bacterium 52_120_T64]|nr:CTP synthase [Rhodobacterales bacterium 52_120_T64]